MSKNLAELCDICDTIGEAVMHVGDALTDIADSIKMLVKD